MLSALALAQFSVFVAVGIPDEIDALGSSGQRGQLLLILDTSCSMNVRVSNTDDICDVGFRANNGVDAGRNLSRLEILKAVLTGCDTTTDGILDLWDQSIDFAVAEYSNNYSTIVNFANAPIARGITQTQLDVRRAPLETAILGLNHQGATNTYQALAEGARYMGQHFRTTPEANRNTYSCYPYAMVLMTDGLPDGADPRNPSHAAQYRGDFNMACDGSFPTCSKFPSEPRYCAPYYDEEYFNHLMDEANANNTPQPLDPSLWPDDITDVCSYLSNSDIMCNVPGDQPIITYGIGFGVALGQFETAVAVEGQGNYFPATDFASLRQAFQSLALEVTALTAANLHRPTISRDGLASGRELYATSFVPSGQGIWKGNLKKYCLHPPTLDDGEYDSAVTTCLLKVGPAGQLVTNPNAQDIWTSTADLEVTEGGAAQRLKDRASTRKIYSFDLRQPARQYFPVQNSELSAEDLGVASSERAALMDAIYARNGANHRLGASIHSDTVILRYGSDCEVANQCFVVYGSNDGKLHFFDTATGNEKSALLLPHFLKPSALTVNTLSEQDNQPIGEGEAGTKHRYFVDGGIRLYHYDTNQNLIIDDGPAGGPEELAYLIVTLGRGGRVMYSIDVSELGSGDNPGRIRNETPIRFMTPGTPGLGAMQQVWGRPWVGRLRVGTDIKSAAVFASGHVRSGSFSDAQIPGSIPGDPTFSTQARAAANCSDAVAVEFCSDYYCDQDRRDSPEIQAFCSSDSTQRTYIDGNGVPLDKSTTISVAGAYAYQVVFEQFDLEDGDRLTIKDGTTSWGAWTRTGQRHNPTLNRGVRLRPHASGGLATPWMTADTLTMRLETDADSGTQGKGFKIQTIFYRSRQPEVVSTDSEIFVVDLNALNDSANDFTEPVGNPLLLRLAKNCGSDTNCSSAGDTALMTCPVNMTPVVLQPGGPTVAALYWGDQCGQIFKAFRDTDNSGVWTVKRLFSAYSGAVNFDGSVSYASKNLRKMMARLEVAPATCNGNTGYGIYFGTGDIQRPGATGFPGAPGSTDARNIMGVIWDRGGHTSKALGDLLDVTLSADTDVLTATQRSNAMSQGWYIKLREGEKVVRTPAVFSSVAFYKTFQSSTQIPAPCAPGGGTNRIYALDYCNSDAAVDSDGDDSLERSEREAWTGSGMPGGDVVITADRSGRTTVTHGQFAVDQDADVVPSDRLRRVNLFRWLYLQD